MLFSFLRSTKNVRRGSICGVSAFALSIIAFNTTDARSQANNALDFDGANDYVALQLSVNGANSLTSFTAEAWIKTTFDETDCTVAGDPFSCNWSIFDFDRSEFFNMYIEPDGQLGFSSTANDFSTGLDDMSSGSPGLLNDGNWHHIAVVYDGIDKIAYADGVEIGRVVNAHGGFGIGDSITRFAIIGDGSEAAGFNGSRNLVYYDGQIDEVRYWNVARTQQEIVENMDHELEGTEAGLVAYYNFNHGVAGQNNAGVTGLTDASGNGHDGTLFNFALNGSVSNWVDGAPVLPFTIFVAIDIKPGSDPNSINLCSGGAVPIAILGSESFDATALVNDGLRFAEASVKVVGKKDPRTLCNTEDVNSDGYTDLICHFITADIAALDGDSTTAAVKGEHLNGRPISGTDSVNIVKDTCT